jgi:hypothetical protein
VRSEGDFSRRRKLPLKHLVGSLLHKSACQAGRGYELICANYFGQLERSHSLSKLNRSSYCEARDKLSWEGFAYLLERTSLEKQIKPERWRGHRVRAVDGSCLQLPRSEEILSTFPTRNGGFGQTYYPYAYLFVAADIFTSQAIHTIIGNKYSSERSNLCDLLNRFEEGDISILDRGLDGKNVWEAFADQGQHYVGRLRARGASRLKFNPNRKDQIVETKLASGKALKIRVVRGQKFRTGHHLFVATNLFDQKKYDRQGILGLYRKRQAIEEVFLHLKNTLHAKNIRSKKLNGVLQEIYAAFTMTSIIAGLRYLFEKRTQGRRISFKAICWRIETAISVLLEPSSTRKLNQLFRHIEKFNHFHQPGRTYPRWSRQPEAKWVSEKRRPKRGLAA